MANTYTTYKDSGIPWIGDIPKDWNCQRLRFLCEINTGNQDTQNKEENGKYPFYVRSPHIERCNNYTFEGESILMAGDGAGAGRVFHHAFGKYAVHQRVYILYNIRNINSFFLFYYISNLFADVMDAGSAQSTVPSVRLPMLSNFCVCIPTTKEQESIANFLDKKCSEIDELISLQEKMIDELKAYKQSVITEAVTKGLDRNVKMKDSGIPWIGEIPKEWETFKIKQLLKNKSVKGFPNERVLSLYRDLGIVYKDSRDDNHNVTSEDTSSYKLVDVGDFVLNKMKAWQGSMAVSNYRGIISPAYYICTFNRSDVCKRYVHYLLRNDTYKPEYMRLSSGLRIGQWDLNIDDFLNISMVFPPLDEQESIANFLDEKCSEIDSLISIKEKKIEELKDYKKSLIYEYVTGKKRV